MSDKLKAAIEVFNRARYFEAAERFESLAAESEGETRDLASAFLRIAAAFHMRFARGGRQSAIDLLSQAMLLLDEYRPARGGVDIERLCRELQAFTEELRAAPRNERGGLKHRARLFVERRRAPKLEPSGRRHG